MASPARGETRTCAIQWCQLWGFVAGSGILDDFLFFSSEIWDYQDLLDYP